MNNTENQTKMDGCGSLPLATGSAGLSFGGCKNHLNRTDLSCCKIRRPDGTPLSVADTWAEIQRLRAALEDIIEQQPCTINGDCFYPMHDGEGNYIGENSVDPLSVIGGMVATAQDALSLPNVGSEPRAKERTKP